MFSKRFPNHHEKGLCGQRWLPGAVVFAALAAQALAQSVTATIPTGSEPFAIAVNPVTNKMYVANYGTNSVTVIDGATNKSTLVAVGSTPGRIAINTVTNKIYVTNNSSDTVTVIDGATNGTTTVAAGPHPFYIAVNPVTNKIYVSDTNNTYTTSNGTVTVIDGATNNTSTVSVPGYPNAIAVNPLTNKIYVAVSVKVYAGYDGVVSVIDGASNATTTVNASSAADAGSVAVNPATNKVYFTNGGSITIVDGATNAVSVLGSYYNALQLVVNPVTNKIYLAGVGIVMVIDGANPNNAVTLQTGTSPMLALNLVTNRVYVSSYSNASVTIIDGVTNGTTSLSLGSNRAGTIAVNPVTNKAYVASWDTNVVSVIDGATNNLATVPAGTIPNAVAANPVTNKIYVANSGSNNVTVIDGVTNGVATVPVGSQPVALAVNPVSNKIYVANNGSANVTVIDGATNGTTNVSLPTIDVALLAVKPWRIAVNPVTNKIYVASTGLSPGLDNGSISVIDGVTLNATTFVAGSVARAIVVNPVSNKVFVLYNHRYGDSVFALDEFTGTGTSITVGIGASGLAVNPVTNTLYVVKSLPPLEELTIINGATYAKGSMPLPAYPLSVAVNAFTNKIYVGLATNVVMVVDATTFNLSAVPVGTTPDTLLVNPVTNKIYAGNHDSNNTAVIDGATNTTSTLPTGTYGPMDLNPVTNKVYVANAATNNVTVITEQNVTPIPLVTSIGQLTYQEWKWTDAAFRLAATGSMPDATYFQVDTWQGPWSKTLGFNPDYLARTSGLLPGFHILYAYAGDGEESTSAQATSPMTGAIQAFGFLVIPRYMGLDTLTQGTWNGHYGADGWIIPNATASLPRYAAVNLVGVIPYSWAPLTTDVRGLQTAVGANTRIASAYSQYPGNSFSVNITFTDNNLHRVGLYLLDWDTTTRSETIMIQDAATNQVLDVETFSNFHNGVYPSWNLQGSVKITITPNMGSAVLSGIFFGPAGAASPAPPLPTTGVIYNGLDTATQGSWTTKYGANGYMIANGTSSAPKYGVASVSGGLTYTWAGLTPDIRALVSAPGSSSRIASAYTNYAGSSFNINVNITDGNYHSVALYLLDWDAASRSQTITIRDASTNALLDTETFSGFQNGQYASWSIRGNVVITVTPNSGTSPAVSGVFFN